jgi:hypothetical protein
MKNLSGNWQVSFLRSDSFKYVGEIQGTLSLSLREAAY